MKNKIIVSNSSPIMNLAIIRHLNLLRDIFFKITVPEEVWRELTIDGKGKPGTDEIIKAEWIDVAGINNKDLLRSLTKDLDIGESAAIALAIERKADMILLDETDARDVAEIYNLPKTGVLGILMRAKQYRMIKEIKPLLHDLRIHANFWIAQPLYKSILIKAGEL